MRPLLALLMLVAATVTFWQPWADHTARPTAAENPSPDAGETPPQEKRAPLEPDPTPVDPSPDAEAPTPDPQGPSVRMPDGSRLALLNGVTEARPPRWPEGTPYLPPTGVYTSPDGTQWYVHGDVLVWTTAMRFRKDLGRMDAGTWTLKQEQARQIEPTRIRPIEGR